LSQVTRTDGACGAVVTGVDLTQPLDSDTIADLRQTWLEHHVLVFPDQAMTDDDLERYTEYFGGFGDDPFIAPIEGRDHVIAVRRKADETAPLFAQTWHSDWSFQALPPAGTCLFGITIPPVGGQTWFADQHKSLAAMPDDLRQRIEGKTALHSAAGAYAPDGAYGEKDRANRSMDIRPSDSANTVHPHPLIRIHPETGEEGLFSCLGYIVGIEGMDHQEARALLTEVYAWQGREEFQYRHNWRENMLVMWDNRSVLHLATGGYNGYDRLLHRTTIAGVQPAGMST
jgi:taurine dioxygenase